MSSIFYIRFIVEEIIVALQGDYMDNNKLILTSSWKQSQDRLRYHFYQLVSQNRLTIMRANPLKVSNLSPLYIPMIAPDLLLL